MNRLWLRASLLVFCLVQFLTVNTIVLAEQPVAGEKLLPKDTLVFLTVSDVKEYKQKWMQTPFGQLLQDRQMQPFLEDVNKKLDEKLKELEESWGFSLSNLLEVSQGQLTFAVLERPVAKFAIVLLVEYGDRQSNVDKFLKETDEALEKIGFEHADDEVDKISLHSYARKNKDADVPFNAVTYFTDKSTLVISTEKAAIKELLDRWDGKSDDILAENEQYKYVQAQCKLESGEPLAKFFVNPSGMIRTALAVVQTSFPQAGMAGAFLPMLGLDQLKGWGGVYDFGDGDVESSGNLFMYVEQSVGILGIFDFPAIQLTPPQWVPANVASYFTTNWNIQGAYKTIETLIDGFQGRGATARMVDTLAERGPMIHLKKDFLDHLDGRIHFMQSEPKEPEGDEDPAPAYFLGLGLKDTSKMKKTLAAAAKMPGSNIEVREFNGESIYEVETSSQSQSLAFGIAEGTLIFTNEVHLLEGVIRGQSGRGLSLVDSPDYKRIAKMYPSKASMVAFQRSDAQIRLYYDLAKKVGNFEGIEFSKLPPFEVISKYLTASGSYSVPDKKGMKTVTFSLKKSD